MLCGDMFSLQRLYAIAFTYATSTPLPCSLCVYLLFTLSHHVGSAQCIYLLKLKHCRFHGIPINLPLNPDLIKLWRQIETSNRSNKVPESEYSGGALGSLTGAGTSRRMKTKRVPRVMGSIEAIITTRASSCHVPRCE